MIRLLFYIHATGQNGDGNESDILAWLDPTTDMAETLHSGIRWYVKRIDF